MSESSNEEHEMKETTTETVQPTESPAEQKETTEKKVTVVEEKKSDDEGKDAKKDENAPGLQAGESSIKIPIDRQKSFGETLTPRQVNMIVLALCLGLFMGALDNTIVVVSLPKMSEDLGSTTDQYYWPVISYLLASTAFAPSYGRFSDLYGRRTVYLFVLVVFLVGSALCGAAVNMEMLIACRAIQGIGGGGLMGLGFVVLGDVVPPRARGKYSGVMGGMFALSSVAGPLVGGVLTDEASWRWCFYINIPIGVVAAVILWFAFRKNYKTVDEVRLDWTGTLLMVVSIVMLELGISWGGDKYAWDDPVILILLVIGALLIIPFIFAQRDAPLPIMPLHLFKKRNVILPAISSFFIGMFMFGAFTYLPLWFQKVLGYSATSSGLQMIPLMAGLIIASIFSGIIMTETGKYKFFPVIGTIMMPIACGLFALFDSESGQETFIPILLLAGLGVGFTIQIITVLAQNDVSLKDIAVATTCVNFFRTIGGSIGVAIFGSLFNSEVTKLSETFPTTIEGIQLFQTGGADAIISYIISLAIRRSFLYFIPFVACAFFPIIFTEEKPLRKTLDQVPVGAE